MLFRSVSLMEIAGVPCGPINTLDRVFDDPQVKARGMRMEMAHSVAGTVPLVANPIRMSETPVSYRRPPPTLGEHTSEVLQSWLSMGEEELQALCELGVV